MNSLHTSRIAFVMAVSSCVGLGQASNPARFESASVKFTTQAGSDTRGQGLVRATPGGRVTAEKALLRYIIQNAYRVKPFQLVGGPDWINTAHYDIEARAEGSPSPQQLWVMLQGLLEERFKLKVHRETQQLPVYALVVAKNGLKLRPPKEGSCVERTPGAGQPPMPPAPGSGQPVIGPCGTIIAGGGTAGMRMDGGKIGMSELTRLLSNMLGRPVIDKTGVGGTFDIHLLFSFDPSLAGLASDPGRPAFAADPAGPSIFTALQEQLGLKLESTKGPVEVVIVDHVEKPSAN